MSRTRTARALPLPALAGATVASCGLLVTATVLFGLHQADSLDRDAVSAGLIAGGGLSLITGLVGAALAKHFARRLRALRGAALRALQDPDNRELQQPARGLVASQELLELARTLDALAVRTRVADEVAERHRRISESASAGVFELLSGLIAAEEGARGQLAAELHDTVAQSVAMARQQLAEGTADGARRAADYVSDAEEQVRAVMARTRPPALRDGDLATAMSNLKAELHQRYGLSVDLSWPSQAHPLPLGVAITIYRFFQEALLNVVKHADVDWAEAQLVINDDKIVATVVDAGPGFDVDDVRSEKGRHVGLGLLRERARLAGGHLEVSSMPSAGTVLQLRLPRHPAPRSAERPVAAPVSLSVVS